MTKIDLDHNIYIKHFSAIISMIRVVKGLRAVSTPASHSLKKWNGRLHEDKWNSTQLTARSVISLLVSSQCDGVSSVSLTLISYMCLVQRFNRGHSLLFRDWIVLFPPPNPPPPSPPCYFPLIYQCERCQGADGCKAWIYHPFSDAVVNFSVWSALIMMSSDSLAFLQPVNQQSSLS